MIFRILAALIFLLTMNAYAAECTAYETSHPLFKLDGAHLSTGKCKTCGSCHINSIYVGTPKVAYFVITVTQNGKLLHVVQHIFPHNSSNVAPAMEQHHLPAT